MSTENGSGSLSFSNKGYLHESYARSLSEFGHPVLLEECGGYALKREIPGTSRSDAMGTYPLFFCREWTALHHDLQDQRGEWVSFSFVVGPFGTSSDTLEAQGLDFARPFKPHFLVDLSVPYDEAVSDHHRYYARRAERDGMRAYRLDEPAKWLDTWTTLYSHLVDRHNITGIQQFSRSSFRKQLEVPGLVAFAAEYEDEIVAMHLWYEMGDVAYSHLLAHSEVGYDEYASYALHRAAIEHFEPRTKWLNLGGGAGSPDDTEDGLSWFKNGWATTSRPSLLCGHTLQPSVYESLVQAHGEQESDYFPAYRRGEMT